MLIAEFYRNRHGTFASKKPYSLRWYAGSGWFRYVIDPTISPSDSVISYKSFFVSPGMKRQEGHLSLWNDKDGWQLPMPKKGGLK